MTTRANLLALVALVAAPVAIVGAPTTAQAAPDALLGPAIGASIIQLPMLATLAELVGGWKFELPELPTVDLPALQARMDNALASFSQTLRELTTYQAPNLRPITTEPIASSHFCEESSGYGWRNDPINHHPKFHAGTDFRGRLGTPVLAAGDGMVVFASRTNGYGNLVIVDHGNGLLTRYGHLRKILAKRGNLLTAGTEIGELGRTGRATGPHLHFEVRIDGRPVDPVQAIQIAELQRDNPLAGDLAAQVLAPELQAKTASRIDPPKSGAHATDRRSAPAVLDHAANHESRPDRPGRVKRVKPLS